MNFFGRLFFRLKLFFSLDPIITRYETLEENFYEDDKVKKFIYKDKDTLEELKKYHISLGKDEKDFKKLGKLNEDRKTKIPKENLPLDKTLLLISDKILDNNDEKRTIGLIKTYKKELITSPSSEFKNSILHAAVKKNNLNIIKLLLSYKWDVNAKFSNNTPINNIFVENPITKNNSEILKYLLEKGANPNIPDRKGKTIAEVILGLEDKNNFREEMFKMLLINGYNPNLIASTGSSILSEVIQRKYINIANLILDDPKFDKKTLNERDKNGKNLLDYAIDSENHDLVSKLIQKGADINSKNNNHASPLHIAAKNNDLNMIKILVNNGAKINSRNKSGETALSIAASKNNPKIINFLLKKGADINQRLDAGNIVLHKNLESQMMRFLLLNGADVNAGNNKGLDPVEAIKGPLYNVNYQYNNADLILIAHKILYGSKVVDIISDKNFDKLIPILPAYFNDTYDILTKQKPNLQINDLSYYLKRYLKNNEILNEKNEDNIKFLLKNSSMNKEIANFFSSNINNHKIVEYLDADKKLELFELILKNREPFTLKDLYIDTYENNVFEKIHILSYMNNVFSKDELSEAQINRLQNLQEKIVDQENFRIAQPHMISYKNLGGLERIAKFKATELFNKNNISLGKNPELSDIINNLNNISEKFKAESDILKNICNNLISLYNKLPEGFNPDLSGEIKEEIKKDYENLNEEGLLLSVVQDLQNLKTFDDKNYYAGIIKKFVEDPNISNVYPIYAEIDMEMEKPELDQGKTNEKWQKRIETSSSSKNKSQNIN